MLEEITNYRKQHDSFKILFILAVICMTLISGGALYYVRELNEKFTNSTYVSVNGVVYKTEIRQGFQYPERYKERILAAQQYYQYRYSADKYSCDNNIRKAIDLCGDCAENKLTEYEDERMQSNILEKGWTYHCNIDSVVMVDEYSGYIYGRQTIRTRSQEIHRNMYIEYTARDLDSRADRNILAVTFDQLEVFNNQILNQQER